MLQSMPVMDETNNYQMYVGMHLEDHMVTHIFSEEQNVSSPSVISVTTQPCKANK